MHYLGHLSSVALLHRLLATGVDVNAPSRLGRTPLGWALFDGAPAAIVEGLLDAGADPTVVDDAGQGVLHLLRAADAPAYLPRLLAAGLDLEARERRGFTPLHRLLLGDAPTAAIRALWQAGADPSARTGRDGRSATELARDLKRGDLRFLR
jgi:ankyrin repeat protein